MRLLLVLFIAAVAAQSLRGQSTNATVSGRVADQTGAAIPGAKVAVININTRVEYPTETNAAGFYVVEVPPGTYWILVSKEGFALIVKPRVELHVQDDAGVNFAMRVGSNVESVTIAGGAPLLQTESATVSTVVNRAFVQDIPLNGRSLQTLVLLTPGTVLYGDGGRSNAQGQFSVNGQRTDANYVTIDGAAANLSTDGPGKTLIHAANGSEPGFDALGGTSSLVSVDAVQEFRIQTSSFAPEYGRTPGAQVGVVTRSGSNAWHGTAFEYLRNDNFDGSDWFNGYHNDPPLRKAQERQNDFGGILGGPIVKDRTFFFFSYEAVRLHQPTTFTTQVPDIAVRSAAPSLLQPFLNAYPKPNGAATTDNLAGFAASVSSPSTLNAYSLRVDHAIGSKIRVFGRYSYSPTSNDSVSAPGNALSKVAINTHTLTVGVDQSLTNRINNELRLNYSNLKSTLTSVATGLGGAVLPSAAQISALIPTGVDPATFDLGFFLLDSDTYDIAGTKGNYTEQRQFNLVDNLSFAAGSHLFKFGIDLRYLAPFQGSEPVAVVIFPSLNGPLGVLSGKAAGVALGLFGPVSIRARNLSLYAQDTWRAKSRLTLTYGLRWDVNPAPHGNSTASDPIVVQGLGNPATMTLAPRGTRFYKTTYTNIAPRIGVVYRLRDSQNSGTVLRGGGGIFYDLGSGATGSYSFGYPFVAVKRIAAPTLPLTPSQAAFPSTDLSARPVGTIYVAEPDLALPRSYQWNVAMEQGLGRKQTVSLTYLGAWGRDLLAQNVLSPSNPDFTFLEITNNKGASSYHALQVKFQTQESHGVQALVSYSYSHSIDNVSSDQDRVNTLSNPNIDRGNSGFDVRHSASGAVTYHLPGPHEHGLPRALFAGWSIQDLLIARTALPVDLSVGEITVGAYFFNERPNVVPSLPLYLYGSRYPGGKAFNPAAFRTPPDGTQGNLGRNVLRGFRLWQDNFAIHRQFNLSEKLNLQFRAECFNLFNHPNFADPFSLWPLTSPFFGLSTETLAAASSFNGQNAIYGVGGPRSWQFGLKLTF